MMKHFLIRLFSFVVFILLSFVCVFGLLSVTQCYMLRMPDGCNKLFLGNSHTEAAINDSIISGAFNFGRSAERIEFLYPKLKMMKRVNPQIDTVYVGLDYILMCHSVEKEFNSVLMHPYNFPEYDFDDWLRIFVEAGSEYLVSFFAHPFSWMKMVDLIHLRHSSTASARDCHFLGGFEKSTRNKLAVDPRKTSVVAEDTTFDRIDMNYYFANKCIRFCQENNIELVFFCTPHHKYCPFAGYQQQIVSDFADIPFINSVRMELPDSCFADLDHLNVIGAEVYSTYLEKQIIHPQP